MFSQLLSGYPREIIPFIPERLEVMFEILICEREGAILRLEEGQDVVDVILSHEEGFVCYGQVFQGACYRSVSRTDRYGIVRNLGSRSRGGG